MVNKVMLIGRLGVDPETRHLDNGSVVSNFRIATSESYKNKEGNRVDQTEWHNIVIWRKGLAEVAEKYLKKGSMIYVDGKLRTRSWDDKDGNTRYTTEVLVDNFRMLDSKKSEGGGDYTPSPSEPAKSNASATEDNFEDDLPF